MIMDITAWDPPMRCAVLHSGIRYSLRRFARFAETR